MAVCTELTSRVGNQAVTFVGRNKDVQSLFDDDEDVVMARPRMRASSTSSGGRTVPASSETDGLGYGAASEKMDQDEDESDIPGPCISLKAKGKIKATKTQVCFHMISSESLIKSVFLYLLIGRLDTLFSRPLTSLAMSLAAGIQTTWQFLLCIKKAKVRNLGRCVLSRLITKTFCF